MNDEINTQTEQEYPVARASEEAQMTNDPMASSPFTEAENEKMSSPLIAEDGSFTQDWYSQFEELSPAAKTLAKFKRPEALAKSYAELEKMHGYPDAGDEGKMAAFRSLVGLPEHAEDFSLTRPEGMSEECWNESLAGEMAKVAHEYGVPARAMDALAQAYASRYSDYMEEVHSAREAEELAAEETLRADWGGDFDHARAQAVSATKLLAGKAGIPSEAILNDPALASNPAFIKMMREAAFLMEEAPLRRGDSDLLVPAEEARRMESDPAHPLHEAYMKHNHPNHRYANEVYDRLAFGSK